MSARMLYGQRKAYAAMGRWRPVHRLLWALYEPVSRFGLARRVWGAYRQVWPR